ncbi:MAG: polysaccharide biosynthesis tyrosine autokinase [Planctomycetes bacterium]|nr:polysaccharide biosynthesis tyrosine autokinase [Planctomycetota bacterium]
MSQASLDPLDDPSAARRNVLRVLAVFRRRGWIPVLASGIAVAALAALSLMKPPTYTASGLVQLGLFSPAGLDPRSPAAMAMFETHHQLLTSHVVVDRAMEAFGYELAEGPERQDQRDEFLSALTIWPIKDTFLIHVEASTTDPRRSAAAVNTLMDAFIPFSEEFLASREVLREQQLRRDERRLLELLREAEERQKDLYERTGYHNFDAQRASPLVRTQDLQGRLTAIQLERALAQTERSSYEQRVQQIANTPEIEQLAGLGGNDPLLQARRELIAELNVRLANLRAHVPPEKLEQLVEYREAEAQLESARRGFRELLSAAARAQMAMHAQREAALLAQERELGELIATERNTVSSLNQLEGQYRAVLRQIEFCERELDIVRNELRRIESRTVGGTGAMVVNAAQPPTKPKPRVGALNLIGAALAVFVMGLLGLVLWDHLDDEVMRPEDLEDTGVPLLGQVPRLDLTAVDELTHLRGSSWAAEALGLIRTNLAVASGGLRQGALLVTSGAAGDGKSFFSLNLATALARTGGRTLLIEADMRRPRIRPLLVLDDRDDGLSDVLVGEAPLEDVVRETEFDGLDFLPSGPCPLNPADVLLRPELEALLRTALERYDHVVIDGPPARPLADASLLARHVHGVVHVARVGASRRSIVRQGLEQIQAVGGRNLGLVLNDVTPEDDPAFRYDGYAPARPAGGDPVPGGFFVVLPQVPDAVAPPPPAGRASA